MNNTPSEATAEALAGSPGPTRLWTRDFILACISNIFMFFNVHLFLATFATYAMGRFLVGDALGGASASIFIIGALAARLTAGPLMARFNLKALAVIGFAAFAMIPPFYPMIESIGPLLALRVVHGMTFGVASSVIATLAVSRIPGHRLGEGTAYYASSTLLGVAAGPFVGLLLLGGFSFDTVVWVAVASSLAGLLLILPVAVPDLRPAAGNTAAPARGWSRLLEPTALPMALIGALFTLGYAGIVTFMGSFAAERSLGSAASFFFLAYAVAVLISRPVTGPLMDRRGYNVVMIPAFVFFAGGLLLLSQSQAAPLLFAAALLIGLGQGNLLSAGQTIAISRVPRNKLGMGTSTFFLGIDLGMGLGPVLIGVVVQFAGIGATYGYLGIYALVLLGIYWWVQGRRLSPAAQGPLTN
ncbi:MFS transporter [Paeniglutamicibacter cryotolerans]|uniref:MFS family permease n=1 Tax=Paeniglutamicibacter cryotolerans TaxID=670079 RepID=A0A839QJ52_9MICC|nr:MFS transporter [Paeniglutamicibacter cryotolerans]MBB2995870.1 MFS family permease [Paeniglutamicibacter cryotolerans]